MAAQVTVQRVPFQLIDTNIGTPNLPSFFIEDWCSPLNFLLPPGPVSPFGGQGGLLDGNHPPIYWHWRAHIPPVPAGTNWIAMMSSICGVASVATEQTEGDQLFGPPRPEMKRAYSVDASAPQVIGAETMSVLIDWPRQNGLSHFGPVTNFPWSLIGDYVDSYAASGFDPAIDDAWQEHWLTEGIGTSAKLGDVTKLTPYTTHNSTTMKSNQRGGPSFEWLESSWRVRVVGGAQGYFVRPFPRVVDYWFSSRTWSFSGDVIRDPVTNTIIWRPPGVPYSPQVWGWEPAFPGDPGDFLVPVNWSFPIKELVVLSCKAGIPSTIFPGGADHGILAAPSPLGVSGVAPSSGQQFSLADLVRLARAAGFAGTAAAIAASIAMAESGGNSAANSYNAGPPPSTDRGLWQINNVYHAEVPDSCAYDPGCAARAAYTISGGGTDWTPWSTYNNGAYLQFLAQAEAVP